MILTSVPNILSLTLMTPIINAIPMTKTTLTYKLSGEFDWNYIRTTIEVRAISTNLKVICDIFCWQVIEINFQACGVKYTKIIIYD